jgi:hypothetical protein
MIRKLAYYVAVAGVVVMALSSIFFFAKMRERAAYINDLTQSALTPEERDDPSQAAVALSRAIYRRTNNTTAVDDLDVFSRWESTSFFNVTAGTSLRYGIYGVEGHSVEGACGTMSRTLLNALWSLGIPARKLQLLDDENGVGGGHTMVEFYDGARWCVISPSDSSFVWRRADGTIATAEEIRGDSALYSAVYEWKNGYPYRFDRTANIRWEKLPAGARRVIHALVGQKRYDNATTPRLYDKPRTCHSWSPSRASCSWPGPADRVIDG